MTTSFLQIPHWTAISPDIPGYSSAVGGFFWSPLPLSIHSLLSKAESGFSPAGYQPYWAHLQRLLGKAQLRLFVAKEIPKTQHSEKLRGSFATSVRHTPRAHGPAVHGCVEDKKNWRRIGSSNKLPFSRCSSLRCGTTLNAVRICNGCSAKPAASHVCRQKKSPRCSGL